MADETTTTTETPNAATAADAAKPADDPGALTRMAKENGSLGADGKLAPQTGVETTATEEASTETTDTAVDDAPDTAAGEAAKDALNAAADAGASVEQLQELAKTLGFTIDDRKIYTRERADFRDYQRKQKAALERMELEAKQRALAVEQQSAERLQRAEAIIAAIQNLDGEELARQGGHKDWNGFLEGIANKMVDPNFKEIQDLKRSLREKEEREEQARQQYAQRQQQAAQIEQENRYLQRLAGELKQSSDPLCRELHDDPQFVRAVAAIQQQHWDNDTRTTIRPEQAVKVGLRDRSGRPGVVLYEQMKALHERLNRALGGNGATAETAPAVTAAPAPVAKPKGANRTQVVKGPPVEPAAPTAMEDKQFWGDYAIKKMKEAAENERSKAE